MPALIVTKLKILSEKQYTTSRYQRYLLSTKNVFFEAVKKTKTVKTERRWNDVNE